MIETGGNTVLLLSVVGGVLILAGLVKGVLGFGPALVSIPVLVQVFDPRAAIAAFSIPMLIANLVIVWRDGLSWAVIRPRWRLVAVVFLTTIVGAVGLITLPADLLSLVVGIGVLCYLLLTQRSGGEKLATYAREAWSEYVAGSVAGVLGGALGMGGLPLAAYLDARGLERDAFTLLLVVLLALNNSVRITALWAGDVFGRTELLLGAAFVSPLFLGVLAGVRVRQYIPADRFEILVRLVLLVSALRLVYGTLS
jgi:hypothetical protein